ncbi:MAG: hypothetical protein KAH77_00235 [Thiomargarita sp.]|nr:hypothetical protein [Thiomargarita sp.]
MKFLPQKDIRLVGTSIFGTKKSVILKGYDNKEFTQRLIKNTRTSLEDRGYEGYYLLTVKAREITIEYPENAPCQKDKPRKGVTCNENFTATVGLVTQRAIASSVRKQTRKKTKSKKKAKKKVIKDKDIPPGMRRVSTPFGDRLAPI